MLIRTAPNNTALGEILTLNMYQGETIALAFQFKWECTPINITGYSYKMQVAFPTPVLYTTGNGYISITDPVNGQIQINVTSAQSAVYPVGLYNFDLWSTDTGGNEKLWALGKIIVAAGVTPVP